jgi:flagellar hook-basal body complex protein FliE
LAGLVAEEANPLSKVFELIDNLKNQIVADGEAEMKAFNKYSDWCGRTSASVGNQIDTSTALSNKLTAKVDELASNIEVGDSKVGDLSSAIAKADAELKAATAIRKKEAEDFSTAEQELMTTVDTLERAVSVLEKELSSGGSLAQIDTSSLTMLLQSLGAVTDAAGLTGSSKQKLLALVQAHEEDGDGDAELGAPAASKYNSKSGGIMDVLDDMKEKAEGQLSDLRRAETQAKNSYNMLRQSLEDELSATSK